MKLLTFLADDQFKLGIKTEKGVLDVSKALETHPDNYTPRSMEQVLEDGVESVKRLIKFSEKVNDRNLFLTEKNLTFGPVVPNPEKIICVGLNYRDHAIESDLPIPEKPVLFNKFNNSLSAHKEAITIPTSGKKLDYEAEMVIIIGKQARNISEEDALDYVFGYCNGNDLSVRENQFLTSQWMLGKTEDGFCPTGPYLVTSDEVGNPDELDVKCFVNREVRQDKNTSDMIFNCSEIVSFISQHMTLKPGDMILTGTPEGPILGYPEDEQVWLENGDEITVEIEKLGKLTTILKQY